MTKEQKQQFTLRITQANSTELVVILYEMLLCYLEEGKQAIRTADKVQLHEAARKARGCLNELIQSLNRNYEIAGNLLQLYLFCLRRLAFGEVRAKSGPFDEIEQVIVKLHEAYQQLAEQNTDGPVMQNSQAVYAGLTYGKTMLTENMADQGSDRGLLV